MGYLVQIILALGALGLAESGFTTGSRGPLLVPLLLLVPQWLGWRARTAQAGGKIRTAASYSAFLSASAPALYLVAVSGLGWHESVAEWTGKSGSLFGWPDFAVFTVLTPFVLLQVSVIDAKARVYAGNAISRKVFRALQLRMFLSSLAPAAFYVLLCALIGLSEPLRVSIEQVELIGAAFSLVLLGSLALVLPTMLRLTWETEPFPGGLHRELLVRVAARAGFNCRELLIWRTGNLMANAAIIGLTPRYRYVLFSDALLNQLDLRELASVFAHEIGHAMRKHVLVFLAWTIAFFLALGFVGEELDLLEGAAPFALVGVALFLGYFGFGYMSRRFELDADLYAMQLLGDPEAMISALDKVGGRLRDVAGWRHFSVSDRVAFLRSANEDVEVAKRLRRTVRRFAVSGVALLVLGLAAQGWSLFSSWNTDQLYVELRLGRYDEAAERIVNLEEPELEELVDRAQNLVDQGLVNSESELTADRFELFALGAVGDENLELALEYLELGVLRGGYELFEVIDVLTLAAEDKHEALKLASANLEPVWRNALAPWL